MYVGLIIVSNTNDQYFMFKIFMSVLLFKTLNEVFNASTRIQLLTDLRIETAELGSW